MKDFIYPEMIVHVPLCTHKDPKSVLLFSDDAMKLQLEVSRHENISATTVQISLDNLRCANDASFDVIISEAVCDATLIAHMSRTLNDEGLLVTVHPSLDDIDANKSIMQAMAQSFKIIMPYRLENGETLLLASKAYHPTADLILQRADMLDGLNYYNSDIHPAAFAMGNYIRKEYLGVIKN